MTVGLNMYVLADVDYEDFNILGVFSTVEKAKAFVEGREPGGRIFWIEGYELDGVRVGGERRGDGLLTWVKV